MPRQTHIHVLLVTLVAVIAGIAAPTVAVATDEETIQIDFPGGTVAEYVEHLRSRIPDLNIIMRDDVANLKMPRVEVTAITLDSLINIIPVTTQSWRGDEVDIYWDGLVYVLRSAHPGQPSPADQTRPTPDIRVQSYSLAHVLIKDHLSTENVLQSIEIALDLRSDDGPKPDIRFHEPTSLLIVRGTLVHLGTINQTIQQLAVTADEIRAERTAQWMREQNHRLKELERELKEQIADRDRIIQELEFEISQLRGPQFLDQSVQSDDQ